MEIKWVYDSKELDWDALSDLYKIAPLGNKKPEDLKVVYKNSKYMCFLYIGVQLIGAGRALADGLDCSYICDVVTHPSFQGRGIGKQIINKLVDFSHDYNKIILYSNIGKENFYAKLGFAKMNTAMAIFKNQEEAIKYGFVTNVTD